MEFFELVCDPGNLKCTFKIQYSDLNVNSTETDCNDQISLRYISHCVRNGGKTLWTTGGGSRFEVEARKYFSGIFLVSM